MKSRMDKYYNDEELMQRTSKNDSLYEELYRERRDINNNVTIIDNVKEIDINKIKEMVDKRESYNKIKDYNNLINNVEEYKNDAKEYVLEELDNNDYDINAIIERKKKDYNKDPQKIRSISEKEYTLIESLNVEQDDDLFSNLTDNNSDDLFSNLKDNNDEDETSENTFEKEDTKENTFYTSTSKIVTDDFEDVEDEKMGTLFAVLAIIAIIIAVGVIVWLKFLN